MNETLRAFVRDHAADDVSELLLHAERYPEVDVKVAAVQIQARARIKEKLPTWYQEERLFYPSVLAVEQCSSEQTARYKQRLVQEDDVLCDLTGGLGVDAFYFSQKVKRVYYVEKNKAYCEAARYNMPLLALGAARAPVEACCNIPLPGTSAMEIIRADAMALVMNYDPRMGGTSVFYIDPSRRGAGDKRVYALSDCEPDLTVLMPLLLKNGRKVIAKLSPMLDISRLLNQLPGICEIHIVSVKNECKELLIVAVESLALECAQLFCINYATDGVVQSFQFNTVEEQTAVAKIAARPGRYLYEPNASVLKAGAFKSVAVRFGLEKLHADSHLYTSGQLLPAFPGRIFETDEVIPFHSSLVKRFSAEIPQANIAVRNFPLSVDALRKRTHIAEGGAIYLFATTLSDNKKALIKCRKVV